MGKIRQERKVVKILGRGFFWGLVAVAAGALLIASCQPSPTPTLPTPVSAPSPSPIPVITPPQTPKAEVVSAERALIVRFARAQLALDKDWEKFRQTYEEWRRGYPCGPETMTQSLNKFIALFQGVKSRVAQLPRDSVVATVAQELIEAAEKEETAIKSLRTGWKPGEESAFEKYEGERLSVHKLRRSAASKLRDLVAASLPENVASVSQYTKAQQLVDRDWDALHQEYDSWRKTKLGKDGDAATLQKFLTDFQAILNRIYALPPPSQVRKEADLLVEAGEKEEAALKKLRDTWEPGDDSALQAYERERLTINKMRRDCRLGVEAATMAGRNRALLEEFSRLYEEVDKSWEEFRASYDAWRNRGGECNREVVAKQLSELVTSFHGLAASIHSLERPAPTRPLAELLIEAAEKEETALRQLRDGWKPYDLRYSQVYEGQWVEIDRLRRQAAADISELMRKYNIPAAEVKP